MPPVEDPRTKQVMGSDRSSDDRPGDAASAIVRGLSDRDGTVRGRARYARLAWRRGINRAVLATHVTSLAFGLMVLSYVDRRQWFFGDDWEFIIGRGFTRARHGLWSPHNEHWSTLPILLYRALFSLFGVRSYVPYIAVLIVAHLVLTHLIWRAMLRVGADPWVATAVAGVFAVLGAGSENLLWAFQIGFVGSVLFGYVALLMIDNEGPFSRRDVLAWVALVAGLMCSGIGVTMVAVSGIAIMLRWGWSAWRRALLVVSLPAAVFLLWFALAGHRGLAGDHQRISTLLDIPTYIWTGLSSALERASGIPGSGPVLVVVVVGWLIARASREVGPAALALALAVGMVLLFLVIALGRSSLGVSEAASPRYSYLALALILPAIGLALTQLICARVGGRPALLSVLIIVGIANVALLRNDANARITRDQPLERRILAAADIVASGQSVVSAQPEPNFNPDVTADSLLRLYRDGKLPTVAISQADRLAAATQMQLAVSDIGSLKGSVPEPTVVGATASAEGNCLAVQPSAAGANFVMRTPLGGGTVQLTSGGGGTIGVFLRLQGGGVGPARMFAVQPGQPAYLSVAAGDAMVTVYFPPSGLFRICRLGS